MKKTVLTAWLVFALLTSLYAHEDIVCAQTEPALPFVEQELWIEHGRQRIFGVLSTPDNGRKQHPIVIIAHGFNGTHHHGRSFFKMLGDIGYMCYTFDFPCGGTGSRTDNNTMNMSVCDEQNALETIVKYFKHRPDIDKENIVLLGSSQGGLVAALTAAHMQNDISRLVLEFPALCIPDNWNDRYSETADIPDTTRIWQVPVGRRYFMEVRGLDPYEAVDAYRRPVLILHGDADQVVPIDYSRRAVKRYKDARLLEIPHAGHGFNAEDFKFALEHIKQFLTAARPEASASSRESLWQSFLTPPDSIRVGCYYYWVNERVDPKGVKADLQWMKDNGVTLAFLATDIRNRTTWEKPWEGQTFGKNRFQSRLWWKNLRTALKTAGELDIEMGLFNCPGWSQSGGPWVKPDEAMRNWTPQGIEMCKTKEGTNVVCSPCSPEAQGLEVDKLSKAHVQKHFEAFIGEILRRIPAKDRPTLTTVVVDSWERGKQNYTDSIFVKFRQRFGYELDYTNEACWKDLDRLIAELVASEYMGGLTEKAHEYGLRTWCEPYAHSPFPANSITYGSAADEVAAEFWVGDRKFRQKEVNAALGAARRSGKHRVWAESFTDGWPEWAKDDWSFEKLKPLADCYFHAGINATILHVMISQPGDDSEPAVRPWFGTWFDRRSAHAADLKPLVKYLRRCNFMLQLGQPLEGSTDQRIMADGTRIRFTEQSLFEVTFPDGHHENWDPAQGLK